MAVDRFLIRIDTAGYVLKRSVRLFLKSNVSGQGQIFLLKWLKSKTLRIFNIRILSNKSGVRKFSIFLFFDGKY